MRILRSRSGATLAELMVTVVVLSVISAGLVRLMSSQSQFINEHEGQSNARRVARSGLNLMFSDLRMTEADSGVIATHRDSVRLRVPYWVGVSCGPDAGNASTHVAMQPIDSMVAADAGYSGYGWVTTTGVPRYGTVGTIGTGTATTCTNAGVAALPGGRVITITPVQALAPVGTPVFLFQRVTYRFGNSVVVPGTRGLFRTVVDRNLTEEIATPFDTSASFRYFLATGGAPVASPPFGSKVVGIELQFAGLNERNITRGKTQRAPLETAVYFKNW